MYIYLFTYINLPNAHDSEFRTLSEQPSAKPSEKAPHATMAPHVGEKLVTPHLSAVLAAAMT